MDAWVQSSPRSHGALAQALASMPALAAMAYPLWLQAFHSVEAPALLLAAFAMPLLAAAWWLRLAGPAPQSTFELRARRLALLAATAPPLFVFCSFLLGLLGRPVAEPVAWVVAWFAAGLWAWTGRREPRPLAVPAADATARVAHGLVAALVLAYIAFHLANHLLGLAGPEAHAAAMKAGRQVYRLPAVEAMLVSLLLLQLALGTWLAWRWSRHGMDGYRAVQVVTGVYVGFFALTHMNSALVSARLLHGIDTNWAWASKAPLGLLRDAWSVRLVPHYALGVFCVLAHLACGLRVVLLAHGWRPEAVNRAWRVGLVAAATVAALIVAGLCGLRLERMT